ncbi:MAG: hypothetical protein AB4290_17485 [Spirulina sp.]
MPISALFFPVSRPFGVDRLDWIRGAVAIALFVTLSWLIIALFHEGRANFGNKHKTAFLSLPAKVYWREGLADLLFFGGSYLSKEAIFQTIASLSQISIALTFPQSIIINAITIVIPSTFLHQARYRDLQRRMNRNTNS